MEKKINGVRTKQGFYVQKRINGAEKIFYYDKSYNKTKEEPTAKEKTTSIIILFFILITSVSIFASLYDNNKKEQVKIEKPISKLNETAPHKLNHGVSLDLIDIRSNINKINEIQERQENTESKVITSLIQSRNVHIKNFLNQLEELKRVEEKFNEVSLYKDGKRHVAILKDKYDKSSLLLQEEYNHILEFDTLILNLLGNTNTILEPAKIKKKFPEAPKEFKKN